MTPPTEQYTIKQRLQFQEAGIDLLIGLLDMDETILFSEILYVEQNWGLDPDWLNEEEQARYEQWLEDGIDFNEATWDWALSDSWIDSVRNETEEELRYSEVLSVDLHTPDDDAEYVAFVFCCGGPHSEARYYFDGNGKPYRIEFYHSWTDGDTTISIPRDSETWLWLWDFMMGDEPSEAIMTLR